MAKDPESLLKQLEDIYGYKLEGSGPIKYHLQCDYFKDQDGNLTYAPQKYFKKLIENFTGMFGHKPKQYTSPLNSNNHPELDTSEDLNHNDIKNYQSMIGSLQWAISLGRFDLSTAVITLSSFHIASRQGHLERANCIQGYLVKFNDSAIRFRTQQPNYSNIDIKEHN